MEVLDTAAAVRARTRQRRAAGASVALVPTMGALHAGHLRLIEVAHEHGEDVVVSIFVNPRQFDRADDFDAYPRPMDADLEACRHAGVAAVYAPRAAAMYPPRFETHVEPGALARPMEGEFRPGHFEGVTTVVAKLFTAVEPDVAVFGQKDYQQLAIVRRMVTDLDFGIEIIGVATVREPDGLALSSRNSRLEKASRAAAACVPHALSALAVAFLHGEHEPTRLRDTALAVLEAEPRARTDYVNVCDGDTLQPVAEASAGNVAATAVWFGDVRLIDNIILGQAPPLW